jgi:hypothetical protein
VFNELVESLLSKALAGMFALICLAGTLHAQDGPMNVRTNLDIMRMLSERIAGGVATRIADRDSMQTRVLPPEHAWYVESSIVSGLLHQGLPSTSSAASRYQGDFGLKTLRVSYDDVRRDGFFGEKVVSRTVQVAFSVKVVDRRAGTHLLVQDFSEEATDTIGLSQIQEVENPNISVTRGTLPAEGFFTSLVEPLVVLGSIAVAVYLLFHVRS